MFLLNVFWIMIVCIYFSRWEDGRILNYYYFLPSCVGNNYSICNFDRKNESKGLGSHYSCYFSGRRRNPNFGAFNIDWEDEREVAEALGIGYDPRRKKKKKKKYDYDEFDEDLFYSEDYYEDNYYNELNDEDWEDYE